MRFLSCWGLLPLFQLVVEKKEKKLRKDQERQKSTTPMTTTTRTTRAARAPRTRTTAAIDSRQENSNLCAQTCLDSTSVPESTQRTGTLAPYTQQLPLPPLPPLPLRLLEPRLRLE